MQPAEQSPQRFTREPLILFDERCEHEQRQLLAAVKLPDQLRISRRVVPEVDQASVTVGPALPGSGVGDPVPVARELEGRVSEHGDFTVEPSLRFGHDDRPRPGPLAYERRALAGQETERLPEKGVAGEKTRR